jgi:hypothetical protein
LFSQWLILFKGSSDFNFKNSDDVVSYFLDKYEKYNEKLKNIKVVNEEKTKLLRGQTHHYDFLLDIEIKA